MRQISNISTNEITRYTVKNIVKNNSDMLTATSKAVELEAMKKRMMRGEVVRFAYMKLNGEVRIAVGTLQGCESQYGGSRCPQAFFRNVRLHRPRKDGLAWF